MHLTAFIAPTALPAHASRAKRSVCARRGAHMTASPSPPSADGASSVLNPPEGQKDIYAPFWAHAQSVLKARLPDLEDYTIPDGFERKEEMVGKGKRRGLVRTTSYAYSTPKLRQIRTAHVQGGAALQVLNFVMFPDMRYDVPFFGADLVTLPGGHLIALDMQPLFHTPEYVARFSDPIKATFERHREGLPWGGDFPDEAARFFSPSFIWSRPSEDEVVQTRVFEAFKDYLNHYLDFVEQAEPVTDEKKLAEIRDSQLAYLKYRAEKDPARGMFLRFYGEEWTEEYIHGFLFDLERKIENGEYVPPLAA